MPLPGLGNSAIGGNTLVTGITLQIAGVGAEFAISTEPKMPVIEVEARLNGAPDLVTAATNFQWKVSLTLNASRCDHGPNRQISHPDITATTLGGRFKIPFTQIRGGNLVIQASATVGGIKFDARLDTILGKPLRIVGTNPTSAMITAAVNRPILRQIIRHESSQRQFLTLGTQQTSACPLFSADNLGGVGLFQITRPAPTDDEIWNWRSNVAAGIRVYNEKLVTAHGYPGTVRKTTQFVQLVQQFNAARTAQKQPLLNVVLPDFTARQEELDACRGFNGWAGHDQFGLPLHEYRVPMDAAGRLVVGADGIIVWEQVPAADRPQNTGDPNYVVHVLAKSSS